MLCQEAHTLLTAPQGAVAVTVEMQLRQRGGRRVCGPTWLSGWSCDSRTMTFHRQLRDLGNGKEGTSRSARVRGCPQRSGRFVLRVGDRS